MKKTRTRHSAKENGAADRIFQDFGRKEPAGFFADRQFCVREGSPLAAGIAFIPGQVPRPFVWQAPLLERDDSEMIVAAERHFLGNDSPSV